jgi:hypothetical protein
MTVFIARAWVEGPTIDGAETVQVRNLLLDPPDPPAQRPDRRRARFSSGPGAVYTSLYTCSLAASREHDASACASRILGARCDLT